MNGENGSLNRARRRAQRGAVLAEFVVAIVPLLAMFFTFTQMAFVYIASLSVRHGAVLGARAAAVILPPNPGNVGSPEDIDRAVRAGLGTPAHWESISVQKGAASGQHELVTVTVRAQYKCGVPLGGRIVCGADGLLPLEATAQLPNQGARYIK